VTRYLVVLLIEAYLPFRFTTGCSFQERFAKGRRESAGPKAGAHSPELHRAAAPHRHAMTAPLPALPTLLDRTSVA
jgi:hypothetical protein